MRASASPRIHCLPAGKAPVVAVFRRGPSAWWHVGRWDLRAPSYEPGAWFKGSLYPRRCDLSPDGRWLCYFALKSASWDVGNTYIAISRLPWLKTLAAWSTCGTWTRGFHFDHERHNSENVPPPNFGSIAACQARYGLRETEPVQFAAERRRGWREASDSPPRRRNDIFDQNRNAKLLKVQPGGRLKLYVESVGWPGGEFGGESVEGMKVVYWLEDGQDLKSLEDLQWADWDAHGRLLAATRAGTLQIQAFSGLSARIQYEVDLADCSPAPSPPPNWAEQW